MRKTRTRKLQNDESKDKNDRKEREYKDRLRVGAVHVTEAQKNCKSNKLNMI